MKNRYDAGTGVKTFDDDIMNAKCWYREFS